MLPLQLVVLKAIAISALSLRLAQPIVPAESNAAGNFALTNGSQGTVNATLLSDSSGTLSRQWDGTIALPLNGYVTSISFPPSNDPSQSRNVVSFSTPSTWTLSGRPAPAPGLPPFPEDWRVMCRETLGTGMNPSSCLDAWTLLSTIKRKVSFGPRSAADAYDVGLPRRYLSTDGTCFIEPSLVHGNTEAHAKPIDASIATSYVIRECVGDKQQGGFTQNEDSGDNLVVSVVSFDPRGVVCSPRSYEHDPSILRACQTIVDEMKTSRGMELFAQESICDPHIETPLPYYYTAPTKGSTDPLYNPLDWPADQDSKAPKCVLRVQGRRPRQFGNWYKIWEAAAAITAMCVRKGKGGYWEGIGHTGSLVVDIGQSRQNPADVE